MSDFPEEECNGQRLCSLKIDELCALLTSRVHNLTSDVYRSNDKAFVRTRRVVPVVEILNAMLLVDQMGPKISEIKVAE